MKGMDILGNQIQCIIMVLSLGVLLITTQIDIKEFTYQAEDHAIDNIWRECSLSQEEWPNYDYLFNEGHYHLELVNSTAFVVKDYVADSGIGNEVWKLKRIYSCENTNTFLAYVESKTEDELYILFSERAGEQPIYIILADIRKDTDANVSLPYGGYAYNSMLVWDSYKDWFDGEAEGQSVLCEIRGEIHDSIYEIGISCAIDDYVDEADREVENRWEVYGNDIYVGKNGYITCVNCQSEEQDIILVFDVSNKTYAVVEL